MDTQLGNGLVVRALDLSQATLQWTTSDALATKPLFITVLTSPTIIVDHTREQGSFVFLMVEPGYSTFPLQCYEMLNDLIWKVKFRCQSCFSRLFGVSFLSLNLQLHIYSVIMIVLPLSLTGDE